eukprot:599589-Amphidinium_carterae.2
MLTWNPRAQAANTISLLSRQSVGWIISFMVTPKSLDWSLIFWNSVPTRFRNSLWLKVFGRPLLSIKKTASDLMATKTANVCIASVTSRGCSETPKSSAKRVKERKHTKLDQSPTWLKCKGMSLQCAVKVCHALVQRTLQVDILLAAVRVILVTAACLQSSGLEGGKESKCFASLGPVCLRVQMSALRIIKCWFEENPFWRRIGT